MKKIGIVTDSAASIPQDLVDNLGIGIVPIGIQIEGEVYREGVDISCETFYKALDSPERMTTSQPSPGDFMEVYKEMAGRAQELISVHITSKSSGTFQVANFVKGQLPFKITLFDSASCSMGQGFMVLEAAKAVLQGRSVEEVMKMLEQLRGQVSVFIAVPTLKYLERSGKVNKVKALVASVLNLKPILSMVDGVAEVVAKVRSYPKALDQVIGLVEQRYSKTPLNVAILHTNAPQRAEEFRRLVEKRLDCAQVVVSEMGSALAVHGGQGMLGLAAYPANCTHGIGE